MLAKFGRFKEPIVRGYAREILQVRSTTTMGSA